jgi:aryl-alcohol dehydrogenase-like predicted oxidoreductase
MYVLHRCDNPPCIEPEHLWEGTQFDNMQDMAAKGRTRSWGKAQMPAARKSAIKASYAVAGVTQAQVATEFGVSQPTVSLVVRGLV